MKKTATKGPAPRRVKRDRDRIKTLRAWRAAQRVVIAELKARIEKLTKAARVHPSALADDDLDRFAERFNASPYPGTVVEDMLAQWRAERGVFRAAQEELVLAAKAVEELQMPSVHVICPGRTTKEAIMAQLATVMGNVMKNGAVYGSDNIGYKIVPPQLPWALEITPTERNGLSPLPGRL